MSGRLRKVQKDRGSVCGGAAFTFARAAIGPCPVAVVLALTLAACASATRPSSTASSPQTPAGQTGPAYGTVAAVRPLTRPSGAAGNDPEAQILTAMGLAAPGAATGSEIVVQTDDGQTLSVVQANAAPLVPGERVEIVPGPMPRLEALGALAPAS